MAKKSGLGKLEAAVGHVFADRTLLERALTHISALPGTPADGPHYQRFEFLGDRVLGLVIADMLFRAYPAATEGELSRRLAHLVRRETCAEVAMAWDVPPHVILGLGERQSGLRRKEALLADVCEAILAAVYLDAGFDAARSVIEAAFGPKMAEPGRSVRDAKSALQEWAMGLGLPVPVYREVERSGPDHAPIFRIEACVNGFEPAWAEGRSKRLAEQAAAVAFLEREKVMQGDPE
ncbi:ribonuclease III [uncultured Alsobacter sp.]|uniref:ribonuclease III n=1 Tax=uncultured Alsobacter sp. TaxID=1748258 RepID=UPI0025DAEBC4|nr:ribonuclease III [uncultured Alsobacter sp.]